jgi:hypothetical protein
MAEDRNAPPADADEALERLGRLSLRGVLIERYRITADQAFPLPARASTHTHRKVRDVADHLVNTGELLGAQPPGSRRGEP